MPVISYVILLDKRTGNRDYLEENLRKQNIDPRFCLVGDGKLFPAEDYFLVNPSHSQVENYNATLSKIFREAKTEKLPWFLLMEDDAKFLPEWDNLVTYLYETPEDWECIYLGCEPKAPLERINDHVFKGTKFYTMHAVLIRESLYDRLLSFNQKQALDVQFGEFHRYCNAYCTSRTLVTQKAGFSEYASIEVPEKTCIEGFLDV